MLVRIPGIPATRLRMTAQLMDLYPTLIRIGTGSAPPPTHGNDLVPVLLSGRDPEQYAFTELPGQLWAVRTLDWKLMATTPHVGELYHLDVDPREQQNVASDEPRSLGPLRRSLSGMMAVEVRDGGKVAHRDAPIDPRVLEQLHALGYLR